jgi:hypothetical protein
MPDVMPSSWFISRRVELPFATAATALDKLVEHRRRDGANDSVPLTEDLDVWPAVALPGTVAGARAGQIRDRERPPWSERR